jgi:hypothetical protein
MSSVLETHEATNPETNPRSNSPRPKNRCRCRRRLKRVLAVFAGIFALFLLACAATLFVITRDIPPPDTAGLETPPPLNTAPENFNTVFADLLARLPADASILLQAARDEKPASKEKKKEKKKEKEKEKEKAEAILRLTALCDSPKFRALFHKAVNAAPGVIIWGQNPLEIDTLDRFRYSSLTGLQSLLFREIVIFHALETAEKGNLEQAVEAAINLLRLSHKIAESNPFLAEAFVYGALNARALNCLNDIAQKHTLPEKILRKTIAEIGKMELSGEIFRTAIRSEFSGVARFLRSENSVFGLDTAMRRMAEHRDYWEYFKTIFFLKFLYQRNRTIAFYEEYVRGAIALSFTTNRLEGAKMFGDVFREKMVARSFFEKIGNIGGEQLIFPFLATYSGPILRLCQNDSKISLTQAHLAICLYRARHKGALPENLQELVKEGFLNEVPKDYLTGKPIRYSKELGLVWARTEDRDYNPPFPKGGRDWWEYEEFKKMSVQVGRQL